MLLCKRSIFCIVVTIMLMSCCVLNAATLTFDEVPSGTDLVGSPFYNNNYRVWFISPFQAIDNTNSKWGPPHSGANVLAWNSNGEGLSLGGRISFGYTTPEWAVSDDITSVSAYFSTKPNVIIKVTAYNWSAPGTLTPVASAIIGASGESWNNRYVEVANPGHVFNMIWIEGVNSQDDLLGFCLDDMTVTPVPEPSSMLVLASGIAGLGGIAFKRKRM